MTVLCVPALDETPWPTLGPQVCAWMEENLVFGPGDLSGQPYRLNNEQRGFVYRFYEVHPRGSLRSGRRRFDRCALSLAKGLMKTELGAAITAAELHPEAPVRCVNWWKPRGGDWQPEGSGVHSPYIPVLATTEEQVSDLGFGVLFYMLLNSRLARDFDIGLERIMRWDGDGVCQPMSSAPNSKDGALTTFQWFDETHRLYLPNQKHAVQTMRANMAKRPEAQPWSLETTTSYEPGQGSVAEDTMDTARQIADGRAHDVRMCFYHREASAEHDVTTPDGRRAAIIEARGPEAAEWSDIDRIDSQWNDPMIDHEYLERVWLNRATGRSNRAFDAVKFKALGRPGQVIPDGALVTLGFDGSRTKDATGLIATDVVTGHQQVAGVWTNPGNPEWEVPAHEVDAAMEEAFRRWSVWRAYCDPYWWESYVAKWAGQFGEKKVITFHTNSLRRIAPALVAYARAITQEELTHDGNANYVAHVGNAIKHYTNYTDPEGGRMWTIEKERSDSPFKIDLAMAGCLSWQARLDALSSGAKPEGRKKPAIIFADD